MISDVSKNYSNQLPPNNLARGLTSVEVVNQRAKYGFNQLPEVKSTSIWRRTLLQFRSPLIYVLLFALLIDIGIWLSEGAIGIPTESIAIALILLINAGLGVYQETKADFALRNLQRLSMPFAWAIRDGQLTQIATSMLVPHDVVRIEAGERVPADGRLLEAEGIQVDESMLSGESLPIDKIIDDSVFSGSLIVRGKGYFEVSGTGASSSMGKLAGLIGQVIQDKTPLEKRLHLFGHQVAKITLLLAFVLVVVGLALMGVSHFGQILLFSVALAVAAIPEGLPAILTLALALGVERMAKAKAVVRRLSAVEALGSVTIIATDKTGTLTENHLLVRGLESVNTDLALRAMVLANDAELATGAGDPLEISLLKYADSQGINIADLRAIHTRMNVLPFDSATKFMCVTVKEDDQLVKYYKGAPETLLELSQLNDKERKHWEDLASQHAAEGHKVLAVAMSQTTHHEHITFLGLLWLWDPPRAEVPDAIACAQLAGIRVLMITGDHPATALSVANTIGIKGSNVIDGKMLNGMSPAQLSEAVRHTNIFARVTAEHKLRLVESLQAQQAVVAMTGDGVNDAAALKRSDVGIAMGQRGSDVTREVADIVLLDDNFATIVHAIDEGRNVYENIQKFIRFLLSSNLALVLLVLFGLGVASMIGLRETSGSLFFPLTAVQLLWINIVTDGLPALALALDRNPSVMQQPPRASKAPLLNPLSLRFIIIAGVVAASAGLMLIVILNQLNYAAEQIRTSIFIFEGLAELAFVYSARKVGVAPLINRALHFAVICSAFIHVAAALLPSPQQWLGLVSLDITAWCFIATALIGSWFIVESVVRIYCSSPRQEKPIYH